MERSCVMFWNSYIPTKTSSTHSRLKTQYRNPSIHFNNLTRRSFIALLPGHLLHWMSIKLPLTKLGDWTSAGCLRSWFRTNRQVVHPLMWTLKRPLQDPQTLTLNVNWCQKNVFIAAFNNLSEFQRFVCKISIFIYLCLI